MNKSTAMRNIGSRVSVWTSLNGEYEGELVDIIIRPGLPWRGRVRIEKIVTPAFFDKDPRQKHPKTRAIGDIIEAGASSIRLMAGISPWPVT